MGWFSTLVIAVITAAFSTVVSFAIADRCVSWYRISSFEGGSGYFVVLIALCGLIAGLVLGLIVARVVAAGASPSFLKGMGYSLLLSTGIAGTAAAAARLMADVPPTLGGERLMLQVEVRWPRSQPTSPALDTNAHTLQLAALSGNTFRTSKDGPLWTEDARLEADQWIAPGAVELFTARGTRVLQIAPSIPNAAGLRLPLPARPGKESLVWSEWMPRAKPGATPLPDGFTYRFRIVPRNQPIRTEVLGPFEVATVAESFHTGSVENGRTSMTATATFIVHYRGAPIFPSNAVAVATLPGSPTALLVLGGADSAGGCQMLEDHDNKLRITRVSACNSYMSAEPLTNDQSWREAAHTVPVVGGRIDRISFMHPGNYLFNEAIFDAGARTVRPAGNTDYPSGYNRSVPPLGISPDGKSYVRLGFSEADQTEPALLVFDTETNKPYLVPIDRAATRYSGADGADVLWLAHYYAWERGTDTHDQLTARTGVKPLPFRGMLHTESGGNLVYHVSPAGELMKVALSDFLVAEFGARRISDKTPGQTETIHIDGKEVHVFNNESEHTVAVFLDFGSEVSLVRRIASKFDAVLATGKYDNLFSYER